MRTVVLSLSLALAVASSSSSLARAGAQAQARALYDEGQTHYEAGEFHRAAGHFLRAYERYDSPAFLFNAAQAYRHARICGLAAKLYREYLSTEPPEAHRPVVQTHIAAMDACVADGKEAPSADALAADTDRSGSSLRTSVGWVSTGLGVGLLSSSALLAWDADRASDRLAELSSKDGWEDEDDDDKTRIKRDGAVEVMRRRSERSTRLAWITGGLGAGILVTGAVLLLTGDDDEERPSSPRVVAVERGAVLGWSWGF